MASRGNGGLFGTDFSYDDFENWRSFQRSGKAERLPDAIVAERAVYVVSSVPGSQEVSAYEKIVTSVDRETCVVLQVDSFEPGGRLRKVLRADPTKVQQVGELYIAGALELEDVVDQTHTKVKVDEVKLDVDIPDGRFRPADLSSRASRRAPTALRPRRRPRRSSPTVSSCSSSAIGSSRVWLCATLRISPTPRA